MKKTKNKNRLGDNGFAVACRNMSFQRSPTYIPSGRIGHFDYDHNLTTKNCHSHFTATKK